MSTSTISHNVLSNNKNEKKGKFQTLNINTLYKGKGNEIQKSKNYGGSGIGKGVSSKRLPPPAILPSIKLDTPNYDINHNVQATSWPKEPPDSLETPKSESENPINAPGSKSWNVVASVEKISIHQPPSQYSSSFQKEFPSLSSSNELKDITTTSDDITSLPALSSSVASVGSICLDNNKDPMNYLKPHTNWKDFGITGRRHNSQSLDTENYMPDYVENKSYNNVNATSNDKFYENNKLMGRADMMNENARYFNNTHEQTSSTTAGLGKRDSKTTKFYGLMDNTTYNAPPHLRQYYHAPTSNVNHNNYQYPGGYPPPPPHMIRMCSSATPSRNVPPTSSIRNVNAADYRLYNNYTTANNLLAVPPPATMSSVNHVYGKRGSFYSQQHQIQQSQDNGYNAYNSYPYPDSLPSKKEYEDIYNSRRVKPLGSPYNNASFHYQSTYASRPDYRTPPPGDYYNYGNNHNSNNVTMDVLNRRYGAHETNQPNNYRRRLSADDNFFEMSRYGPPPPSMAIVPPPPPPPFFEDRRERWHMNAADNVGTNVPPPYHDYPARFQSSTSFNDHYNNNNKNYQTPPPPPPSQLPPSIYHSQQHQLPPQAQVAPPKKQYYSGDHPASYATLKPIESHSSDGPFINAEYNQMRMSGMGMGGVPAVRPMSHYQKPQHGEYSPPRRHNMTAAAAMTTTLLMPAHHHHRSSGMGSLSRSFTPPPLQAHAPLTKNSSNGGGYYMAESPLSHDDFRLDHGHTAYPLFGHHQQKPQQSKCHYNKREDTLNQNTKSKIGSTSYTDNVFGYHPNQQQHQSKGHHKREETLSVKDRIGSISYTDTINHESSTSNTDYPLKSPSYNRYKESDSGKVQNKTVTTFPNSSIDSSYDNLNDTVRISNSATKTATYINKQDNYFGDKESKVEEKTIVNTDLAASKSTRWIIQDGKIIKTAGKLADNAKSIEVPTTKGGDHNLQKTSLLSAQHSMTNTSLSSINVYRNLNSTTNTTHSTSGTVVMVSATSKSNFNHKPNNLSSNNDVNAKIRFPFPSSNASSSTITSSTIALTRKSNVNVADGALSKRMESNHYETKCDTNVTKDHSNKATTLDANKTQVSSRNRNVSTTASSNNPTSAPTFNKNISAKKLDNEKRPPVDDDHKKPLSSIAKFTQELRQAKKAAASANSESSSQSERNRYLLSTSTSNGTQNQKENFKRNYPSNLIDSTSATVHSDINERNSRGSSRFFGANNIEHSKNHVSYSNNNSSNITTTTTAAYKESHLRHTNENNSMYNNTSSTTTNYSNMSNNKFQSYHNTKFVNTTNANTMSSSNHNHAFDHYMVNNNSSSSPVEFDSNSNKNNNKAYHQHASNNTYIGNKKNPNIPSSSTTLRTCMATSNHHQQEVEVDVDVNQHRRQHNQQSDPFSKGGGTGGGVAAASSPPTPNNNNNNNPSSSNNVFLRTTIAENRIRSQQQHHHHLNLNIITSVHHHQLVGHGQGSHNGIAYTTATAMPISPSAADLNFKIASVKKVWDDDPPASPPPASSPVFGARSHHHFQMRGGTAISTTNTSINPACANANKIDGHPINNAGSGKYGSSGLTGDGSTLSLTVGGKMGWNTSSNRKGVDKDTHFNAYPFTAYGAVDENNSTAKKFQSATTGSSFLDEMRDTFGANMAPSPNNYGKNVGNTLRTSPGNGLSHHLFGVNNGVTYGSKKKLQHKSLGMLTDSIANTSTLPSSNVCMVKPHKQQYISSNSINSRNTSPQLYGILGDHDSTNGNSSMCRTQGENADNGVTNNVTSDCFLNMGSNHDIHCETNSANSAIVSYENFNNNAHSSSGGENLINSLLMPPFPPSFNMAAATGQYQHHPLQSTVNDMPSNHIFHPPPLPAQGALPPTNFETFMSSFGQHINQPQIITPQLIGNQMTHITAPNTTSGNTSSNNQSTSFYRENMAAIMGLYENFFNTTRTQQNTVASAPASNHETPSLFLENIQQHNQQMDPLQQSHQRSAAMNHMLAQNLLAAAVGSNQLPPNNNAASNSTFLNGANVLQPPPAVQQQASLPPPALHNHPLFGPPMTNTNNGPPPPGPPPPPLAGNTNIHPSAASTLLKAAVAAAAAAAVNHHQQQQQQQQQQHQDLATAVAMAANMAVAAAASASVPPLPPPPPPIGAPGGGGASAPGPPPPPLLAVGGNGTGSGGPPTCPPPPPLLVGGPPPPLSILPPSLAVGNSNHHFPLIMGAASQQQFSAAFNQAHSNRLPYSSQQHQQHAHHQAGTGNISSAPMVAAVNTMNGMMASIMTTTNSDAAAFSNNHTKNYK